MAPEKDRILLLVDDDAGVRRVLMRLLQRTRWNVVDFANPIDALAHINQGQPFDAVLSDYDMPQMRGTELFLGVSGLLKGRPFVIQTGSSLEIIRRVHARDIPPSLPILQKPVNPRDLLRYLEGTSSPRSY